MENMIRVKVLGTAGDGAGCIFTGALADGSILPLEGFIAACEGLRSEMQAYSLRSFRFAAAFEEGASGMRLDFIVSPLCPIRNAILIAAAEGINAAEENEWTPKDGIPFLSRLMDAIGEPEKAPLSASVTIADSPFMLKNDGKDQPLRILDDVIGKAKALIDGGIASAVRLEFMLTVNAAGFRIFTRGFDAVIGRDSTAGSIIDAAIEATEGEIGYEMGCGEKGASSEIARLRLEKAVLGWLREEL